MACGGGEYDAAKREVEKNLKDPASAQYRNMKKSAIGAICGEVNAKNSMGGYSGFGKFMYFPSQEKIVMSPDEDSFSYGCR